MVTKELLDFVRAEFAQGTTKESLMKTLMGQNWSALDIHQAFTGAEKPIPPILQNTVSTGASPVSPTLSAVPLSQSLNQLPLAPKLHRPSQHSGMGKMIGITVSILLVCIIAGGSIVWYGPENILALLSNKKTVIDSEELNTDTADTLENTDEMVVDPVVSTTPSTDTVSATAPTVPSKSVDTEKEAMIAGILKTRSVLTSNDVAKIRTYLSARTTTSDQRKKLADTSDKDLLLGVALINAFQTGVTDSVLRSPDTLFTKKSDGSVDISFYNKTDKTKVTLTAIQINGVWY